MSKDDEGDDLPPADDGAHDQEEIGYKQPPRRTRFRRGRSPNPSGRPKGARGHVTIMREVAYETRTVIGNGKPHQRTNVELVLLALRNHAATGNARAMGAYEKYQELFGHQEPLQPPSYVLIPEAPTPEEFERMLEETRDNWPERLARLQADHELLLEK